MLAVLRIIMHHRQMRAALEYYSHPGEITGLEKYADFLDWLSADPGAMYQVAQGLIVHDMWLDKYGIAWNPENEYTQKTVYMQDILDKALTLDGRNLSIPRPPEKRVIACCREFASLMCALLRAKGLPGRSRCGFAIYFGWNGLYEDHWICEYWNGRRWVMADPQLDPFQESTVKRWAPADMQEKIAGFDPRDLTPRDFLTAGRAWTLCRSGKLDAAKFGIGAPIKPEWGVDTLYGLWFVRGNLLRDFAALNKVEVPPFLARLARGMDWKSWRLVNARDGELSAGDWALLDRIAALSTDADASFEEIRRLYDADPDLQVPEKIVER
jgi:hypothetical protein